VNLLATLLRHPLIRFAMIGAGGYIVDASVLWFDTRYLGMGADSGRVVSIFAAMCFTWLGNRYLTFAGRRAHGVKSIMQEWMKFVGANLVGALVSYSTYWLLVHFAPSPLDNIFVAQICGVLVGMTFNFTFSKYFVFSK
jgi:putative flippase GtrA